LEEEHSWYEYNYESSSIFKLSYPSYSSAYVLEYSFVHVIIMIYELVYSLYVMILTCLSSLFNVHMICMSRSRIRVRVVIHCTFRFAHVIACQSVGLES
jgi:hypothetical protein